MTMRSIFTPSEVFWSFTDKCLLQGSPDANTLCARRDNQQISVRDQVLGLQQQLHQHQRSAQQLLGDWQQQLDEMARQLDAL